VDRQNPHDAPSRPSRALSPLLLAAAGFFLPIFCARGLIYVIAPLALLAAAGAPRGRALAVAILILGTLPATRFFTPALERENWRAAVAHLRAHAKPGDLVLVHEGFLQVNVEYYWQGYDRPPLLGVGERGVPIEEAVARARTRPLVWVLRRTYDELPAPLTADFPVRQDNRWQHVGVLRMSR